MATISGVQPGRLRLLEEMLWEWTIAQERSCRLWGWEDAPWWYGERASLSTLAGAIWRSGGVALEEYSVRKSTHTKKGKHALVFGRNDLYFTLGRDEFILEAKPYWPNLRSKFVLAGLKDCLKSAIRDVRRMRADGARRLASVFIAPRIPAGFEDEFDVCTNSFIHELNSVAGSARAWIFPDKARHLASERTERYYPGAALIIQEA